LTRQPKTPSLGWSICDVHHGYRAGTPSRYWFADSSEPEQIAAVTRAGIGIIHILRPASIWTAYHENNGHHSLTRTDFGTLNIIVKNTELLLLKLAGSRAQGLSKKIDIPVTDPRDLGDAFIEGAITGAQWLHRFSTKFQESSIITHEGMSDWIADRRTGADSLPYFTEAVTEHSEIGVHIEGLTLVRELASKFGINYVHQAVGAAMAPPFPDFTYDMSEVDRFFAEPMHQPDHRLRELVSARGIPNCFPQPYLANPLMMNKRPEFWDFVGTVIPMASDKDQAVARMTDQMLYGLPFIGLDKKLVRQLQNGERLDISTFFGNSLKHLSRALEDPRMRALFVKDVRRLKEARAAGHNWTGAKLADMLFDTNSPIEILDYGRPEGGVRVETRPDLDSEEVQSLLFKDFCDIFSELLFSVESKEALLPCYMGFADECDSCKARQMLQSFRARARCFLWCRRTGLFYRFDEKGLANDGAKIS
jgi:hypothetical protein